MKKGDDRQSRGGRAETPVLKFLSPRLFIQRGGIEGSFYKTKKKKQKGQESRRGRKRLRPRGEKRLSLQKAKKTVHPGEKDGLRQLRKNV